MLRQRSKTRKVFHLTSSVLSLLANSSKMVVLFRTITFRRSQHCIWCCVFAVESRHCKDMYRIYIALLLTCKCNSLLASLRNTIVTSSPRTTTSFGDGIAHRACKVYAGSRGIYVQN